MDLREKFSELLDNTRITENFGISGNLLITNSFAIMTKANVYIVAENDLHIYVRLFKSWGLNVRKVVCFLPKDFQKVDDVEIISPADLPNDDAPNKILYVFKADYKVDKPEEFWSKFSKIFPAFGIYYVDPGEQLAMNFNHPDYDVNSLQYYQSHKKELLELFDSLADETSKQTLYYYVETYLRNTVYKGEHTATRWKYFFGREHERLYKHLDGECWINCGANIGDTVFQYLSFDFKPKKIYAFEGDKKIYDSMLTNLKLLPPDKRELVEPINQMIDETTDFEKILAGNKCTLLNADIEGAELSLLHAMKNVIQADRPVMAICVYHFKEDLLTVPQFIQSICPDYVYYLRKYASYIGHWKHVGEMTLYAVPVERAISFAPPPVNLLILAINCRVRDKKFSSDIIAALCFAVNFFRSEVYGSKIYKRRRKSRLAARLHFGRFAGGRQSFERVRQRGA
ncbi:MAG: hypothetical protein IJP68_07285 [Selenomonadaceae bacterium]|nr:hypothetical protein [Selenomonadaceae bacterium]